MSGSDNRVKQLAAVVGTVLKQTNAYASGSLRMVDPCQFVRNVLADFDRRHEQQLVNEYRVLSGETVNTGNAFIPASFQREVIREALADLNILNLVKTSTDPTAMFTTTIPYEDRASSSSIPNEGIVYEGRGIPFAGHGVKQDVAYLSATKLAFKVSNEILHFGQTSQIHWDAWADSVSSNARLIKELLSYRIANEMLRASDTYLSQTVADEAFTADNMGRIKTAQFPVVRPKQLYDLQGNTIGNPECPITIIIGGTVIDQFTGNKQPAGVYWSFVNGNIGYINLVDNAGQASGAGLTGSISYSVTFNVVKFDLSHPDSISYEKHLNKLVSMVGDQKAMLASQRYSRPDYALMSYMMNNEISKSEQFVASLKRDGTNTNFVGDLSEIKGIPSFESQTIGDAGDHRILLGQRGLTGYTIAKPYAVGTAFEAVDSDGQPTGEKLAYGEEYSTIHTPKPVRNRYTSILIYDSTTR